MPALLDAAQCDAAPLHLTGQTGLVWRAPSSPSGVVVLAHGLQSHAGWFVGAGDALASRGLAVYAPDRRGSGRSREARGDVRRYWEWFEDIEEVVRLARSDYPGVPVHLVGHCFGANLALGVALRKRVPVATVAMLTPGLFVLPGYSAAAKVRIATASLVWPSARFRVPQEDALFSRDPEVLAWIGADALSARSVTARCLVQVNRMLTWLRASVGDVDVPMLVLEASRDRLSDNVRNRQLLGSRCQWLPFDAEHFLLAEPCAEQVTSALADWARANSDV